MVGPLPSPWTKRLRILARIGAVVGGILLVLGLLAGLRLVGIAGNLRDARSLIESADAAIADGRLAAARDDLTKAEGLLVKANRRLYSSPEFSVLGWAPVVGPNLSSLRDSVGKGMTLVSGGRDLLELSKPFETASGTLEVSMRGGSVPLDALEAVQKQANDLAAILPGPDERPGASQLLGPVKSLQDVVYEQSSRRRDDLTTLSQGLNLLADMAGAGGDRRYLIAVANTAEMRGSGGMILSYGVLTSTAGTFTLTHFGAIDELLLAGPVSNDALGLPEDYLDRWKTLSPLEAWRNVNLGPEFAYSATAMEAMFAQKTALPIDGVIQMDPAGLAAIVRGIGPVEVAGVGTVTADNLVDLTLNRAYTQFPDRDQRQEVTSNVAEAVLEKLFTGQFDSLRTIGGALVETVRGRHVVFSASTADSQAALRHFDADGALPAPDARDYGILTVQNFAGNKLDYYADTSLQIEGTRPGAAPGEVTATITVSNPAQPDSTTPYVFGPFGGDLVRGQLRSLVSLYLPTGTTLVGSAGGPTRDGVSVGTEGGRFYVGYSLDLLPGETKTVTLQLLLPPRPRGDYSFTFVASPRVRPTGVGIDLDLGGGQRLLRPFGPLSQTTVISTVGKG